MRFKRKKIKINFTATIRYFYPATIALIVFILIALCCFLYQNVYKTLAQMEQVTELKKETADETLEKEKFNQILADIKKKQEKILMDVSALRNPFDQFLTSPEPKK